MIILRNFFPNFLSNILWGNRNKWGKVIDKNDKDWVEWQNISISYYLANQRRGIGTVVNDAGYEIMKSIDLTNKSVLELGAGDIRHHKFWNKNPKNYILVDVSKQLMEIASQKLKDLKVKQKKIVLKRNEILPISSNSIDIIVSFYSLEHLHPLKEYIIDFKRVLKPGGVLIGAIPSEGGIAWGLGRFLTSRRWVKINSKVNFNKIICWEHPNFSDTIITILNNNFKQQKLSFWPLSWLKLIDMNLILKFKYFND